jgi:serine/threonine protein kinase
MSTTKIGKYELQREIDRGGMAVVYLGRDPEHGRAVAIKILPREYMFSPKFRARFEREAKVLVSLQIDGIVPVYAYGEQKGRPYLVMRYMSGGSLSHRIQSGPMTLGESASILNRIAPALDEAHHRGIIHRDLKPANVLFDESNKAYLADFGVVKMTEGHSMTLTTQGGIVGTPAYMSPEQVMGKETLDGRSDIYALGAILYQMLSGRAPYHSDTPMGQAMMHVVEPLPNILEVRPKLPKETQAIIEKAMAKDRKDRYPSAMALATDVDALAKKSGQKVAASVPIKKRRSKLPLTVLLGGALLLLCLVVVSAGAVYMFTSGEDEEPTSTRARVILTDTPEPEFEPSETVKPPSTAAIILPGMATATELGLVQTESAPGLLPTLRATPTDVTPSPTVTRRFIPTAIPTDTPPPAPPPPQPTSQPPPPPPPSPTNPPPPTNTPEPAPPTNTPPPIHTQAAQS